MASKQMGSSLEAGGRCTQGRCDLPPKDVSPKQSVICRRGAERARSRTNPRRSASGLSCSPLSGGTTVTFAAAAGAADRAPTSAPSGFEEDSDRVPRRLNPTIGRRGSSNRSDSLPSLCAALNAQAERLSFCESGFSQLIIY